MLRLRKTYFRSFYGYDHDGVPFVERGVVMGIEADDEVGIPGDLNGMNYAETVAAAANSRVITYDPDIYGAPTKSAGEFND